MDDCIKYALDGQDNKIKQLTEAVQNLSTATAVNQASIKSLNTLIALLACIAVAVLGYGVYLSNENMKALSTYAQKTSEVIGEMKGHIKDHITEKDILANGKYIVP